MYPYDDKPVIKSQNIARGFKIDYMLVTPYQEIDASDTFL